MSTSTPFTAYQQWLQTCTQSTSNSGNAFWQGHTAYWETFGSIMQQRIATFAALWTTTPEWQSRIAQCTSFPEFCETYTRWCGESVSKTATLTADVLAQRAWLWQQWQTLGQRAGVPGITAMQTGGSTISTPPTASSTPAPASSTPTATGTSSGQASASGTQRAQVQAIIVPPLTRVKATVEPSTQATNGQLSLMTGGTVMLAPRSETETATATPLRPTTATPLKVSRTATGMARTSAQAAGIAASSSPRRSVVASRRARSRTR